MVASGRASRDTPFEPAKVGQVFAAYEQVKRSNGVIDFEDSDYENIVTGRFKTVLPHFW